MNQNKLHRNTLTFLVQGMLPMSKVKVRLPYYIGGGRIWESSNVELLRKLLTII